MRNAATKVPSNPDRSPKPETISNFRCQDCALLTSSPCDPRTASAILNRVSKLRVLDPACGSRLVPHWRVSISARLAPAVLLANDPAKWAKGGNPCSCKPARAGGSPSPSANAFCSDNIYGVDIDAQAVEVTKLSLLLKVLEGETQQTLQTFFRIFQERALPDLGDNIKCGNSLIGPDFYQQQEMTLLTKTNLTALMCSTGRRRWVPRNHAGRWLRRRHRQSSIDLAVGQIRE